MDSAKLNDWMQVVGIFAVVASLIFVGLQMKQAQDIAVAAQYQERTASSIEAVSARSQIASVKLEMAKIISDRYASYDSTGMSPEDLGGLYFGTRISFMSIDNVHFQWESGFMDDAAWQAYRAQLKGFLSRPMGRFIVESVGDYYRPSFRDVCYELIAENERESR